jgi:hypothetical protein
MYRDNTAKKIEEIQYQLALGKTRPDIAKALGFSDVTGLYHFASRHKLVWNADKKNYDATGNDGNPIEAVKPPINVPTGKAANIISMFERGMDGREIAKKLRFTSYKDMADFMKSKGYIWDEGKQNYFLQPQEVENIKETSPAIKILSEQNCCNSFDKYSGLLKMLEENKEQLFEILHGDKSNSSLPRYIIAGVTITKTIGMNNSVDRIVKDFCNEMNLTQKDFFEIAAIELLKRNGYVDIVKANLKV